MVHVLIRHKIADFKKWKEVFDAAFNMRHGSGEASYSLYCDADDPNVITMLCDWDTIDRAQKFFSSETLRSEMKKSGVLDEPEVHYMYEVRTMRRTAAD